MRDSLFRASWQWSKGRKLSVEPPEVDTVIREYAQLFLTVIGLWLLASNNLRMRAEVFKHAAHDSLWAVRFVLEEEPASLTDRASAGQAS